MLFHRALACALLLTASACLGGYRWEEHEVKDDGAVCVRSGPGATLEANAPLRFSVTSLESSCLSGSCSRHMRASCETRVEAGEIKVVSLLAWEEATRGSCTEDCNNLSADCQSEGVPAGVYTLRHGDRSQSLTIPGPAPATCLGEGR